MPPPMRNWLKKPLSTHCPQEASLSPVWSSPSEGRSPVPFFGLLLEQCSMGQDILLSLPPFPQQLWAWLL